MFCNGFGEVLRKPFSVKNTSKGVEFLLDQVSRTCRHRHINPEHVFFGGEDANSYIENFTDALRAKGWLVANVNACEAKKHRENLQASTDRIDLMGIATMLLNRRAKCCSAQSGVSLFVSGRPLKNHFKKTDSVRPWGPRPALRSELSKRRFNGPSVRPRSLKAAAAT